MANPIPAASSENGSVASDPRSVLLLTLNIEGVAAARMPRELQRAGIEVSLLAPRSAVAMQSRFPARKGFLPDHPNLYEWIQHLATSVRAVRPAWILPGDDVSLRLLMQLVVAPPANLVPAVQQELAALIRRSLGDPAHYLDSVDKALLMPIARRLGVDVPDGEAVADEDDAVRVAADLGYPVIVRPAYGNAGRGVARCVAEADVRDAMRAIRPPMGWAPSSGHPALVQRFITGQNHNRPALAWEGREVAGFTRMSVRHYPEPSGPGSVSRYRRVPAIAEANRRLLEALGITGFTGTQFLVEEGTGRPFLIEINRRMTPATHSGSLVGVDLAAAFAACAQGLPWTGATDLAKDEGPTIALFPQEWMRDPASPLLNSLPNDVPWDDPAVVRAFLDPPGLRG